MAHNVKCYYCSKTFNRDKEPFVAVSARRYAHKECAERAVTLLAQDEKDKKELEEYIMKLFNVETLKQKIHKQIKQYHNEYNYTYSGMKKALIYFYDIKSNSIEKSNGGIGIIPYIYNEAHDYYYKIWEAQQKNNSKDIIDFTPKIETIVILNPERKNRKKRKLFTFLD